MATNNNTPGWLKTLLLGSLPTVGTIITVAYYGGLFMGEFKEQGKKQLTMGKDIDYLKEQVDTIKSRQQQNNFNNQLQFQAIWNELRSVKGAGHSKQGYVSERYMNDKLVLSAK